MCKMKKKQAFSILVRVRIIMHIEGGDILEIYPEGKAGFNGFLL